MSVDSECDADVLENIAEVMDGLSKELQELYSFRDLFFENHSLELALEKNKLVDEKKDLLIEKFESFDVDDQIPITHRAQFLYMKGRCYNISTTYDARATQCLSKAVKLNPHLVDAWNELGECYWKNMNVKEAKASFEGALKHERNRIALRCLSIILRQENVSLNAADTTATVLKSVDLAKEAVAQDIKDGVSWTVLGNAYLCQYFIVAQEPATLKLCMSAYKQAWSDPIAKGQPDLYYNRGIALKYSEQYKEAIESFELAGRLDPAWDQPGPELSRLMQYLEACHTLTTTRGKLKAKRLSNMIQSIDKKYLGSYNDLQLTPLADLQEGPNEGKVVLGRVVGSVQNENAVPFTFGLVDASARCVCVCVYNWADGRGAIVGDTVALPRPLLATHQGQTYNFHSIRVNNPMLLLVNGKRVGRNQIACTKVTSTFEIH